MAKEFRILMLEDEAADAELAERELRKAGIAFTSRRVDTKDGFVGELRDFEPDLILADYTLPTFDGLSALDIAKERCPDAPFVFVSGTLGEETAIETLKRGATDYILKNRLSRLGPSVHRALSEAETLVERKRAEHELRELTAELQAIFEAFPDIYFRLDSEGAILSFNASRLCGLSLTREAVIGTKMQDAFPASARDRFTEAIHLVLKSGKAVQLDTPLVVQREKKVFEGKLLPLPEKQVLVIFRDITERKQAEMSLDRLGRQSRAILDSAGEGVVGLDVQGRHTFANLAATKMLGFDAQDLLGQPAHSLWHHSRADRKPKTENQCPICRSCKDGSSHRVDNDVFWRKDGTQFPVEYTATPVRETGRLVGSVVVFRDITQRKQAENELRQSHGRLERMMAGTIKTITRMVELRDPHTAGHERRVTQLACAIAEEMGLSTEQVEAVRMVGHLHDIGKIVTPMEILSKPERLDRDEFAVVKTHSQTGYQILKGLEFPQVVAIATIQHHERMNGSGYPAGLSGEEIILEARILAVADVVESMSSPRPYRESHGVELALKEIAANKGVLYDENVVDACLRLHREKGFRLE